MGNLKLSATTGPAHFANAANRRDGRKPLALVIVLVWKSITVIVVACFKLIAWMLTNFALLLGLAMAGLIALAFL